MSVLQKKNFLINLAYALVLLLITAGLFKFAFAYLMPFVMGFLIATCVKPFVGYTYRVFGDRKLLAIAVVVLFYIIIGALLFWALLRFIAYVQMMIPVIESFYDSTLKPAFFDFTLSVEQWVKQLDPGMVNVVDTATSEIEQALRGFAQSLSTWGVGWITGLVASIPNLFFAVLITIISSFFFTIDYHNVVKSTLSVLSPKTRQLVLNVKDLLSILLGKYLKSYLIIISITFVELSIGFSILGVQSPILLAGLVAVIDILPVLGTGTILMPWAVYSLVMNDVRMGIGLIILYAIITIIRNILEPKVIGHEIGLHPLVTLVSIFVGLRFFGFWGLFGVPIFVTIVVTLQREGKINLFEFFGFKEKGDDTVEVK